MIFVQHVRSGIGNFTVVVGLVGNDNEELHSIALLLTSYQNCTPNSVEWTTKI